MIIAIGTDIVEVKRIRAALQNPTTGTRFRDRLFTPAEIAYCARRRWAEESYAARFAAKEAVIKALGGKFGNWREIEIQRHDDAPELALCGRSAEIAAQLGIQRWHLSLSHSDE